MTKGQTHHPCFPTVGYAVRCQTYGPSAKLYSYSSRSLHLHSTFLKHTTAKTFLFH